jgi:hypothetical protein
MYLSTNKITKINNSVKIKLTLLLFVFILSTQISDAYWDKITNIPQQYQNNIGWLEFWFLKTDPNYGWVCGFEGKVIRTTDGGKSWKGTIIAGATQLESICFPEKLIGYVSGTKTTFMYGQPVSVGAVFKSVDGGATWKEITPPLRNNLLWGNYFFDKNNGMVVGGACGYPQQFFRTNDGGKTWNLYEDANYRNTSLSDVLINPDGTGYAVSSGHLWVTSDGGYRWNHVSSTGGEDWQEDMHVYGSTILLPYSTGCDGNMDNGGIRTSRNAGTNWSSFPTGNAMFGGWLLDNLRGWACGHSSSCYYTGNGGTNWEMRNCGIDDGEVLDDFWFINDTTGYVCGRNIYRYSPPKNIKTVITPSTLNACDGDTITLSSNGKYFHYQWSNGSSDSLIKVTKSGKYELVAYNTECDTLNPASVIVNFSPKPNLILKTKKNPIICEGDSLILYAITDANSIQWSTGETTDSIIVKTDGTYKVEAMSSNGCKVTSEIQVRISPLPKPALSLNGRNKFCIGDSTELIATLGYKEYYWSRDNSDITLTKSNKIKVGLSGVYRCIAINDDDCVGKSIDSIVVVVMNETNRLAFINSTDKEIEFDSVYYPYNLCIEIGIYNPTDKEHKITLPYLKQNKSFSFPLSQFPITVSPGDTAMLKACYNPSKLGVEKDTCIIDDICNPHNLFLKGLSLAASYESSSICEAPIIGRIISLPGKYSFSTKPPSPNPSSSIIRVEYSKELNDGISTSETADLFDIYGNLVERAFNAITSIQKSEDLITETGVFEFNTQLIESGTYFIIIRTLNDIKTYKQLIIK